MSSTPAHLSVVGNLLDLATVSQSVPLNRLSAGYKEDWETCRPNWSKETKETI